MDRAVALLRMPQANLKDSECLAGDIDSVVDTMRSAFTEMDIQLFCSSSTQFVSFLLAIDSKVQVCDFLRSPQGNAIVAVLTVELARPMDAYGRWIACLLLRIIFDFEYFINAAIPVILELIVDPCGIVYTQFFWANRALWRIASAASRLNVSPFTSCIVVMIANRWFPSSLAWFLR
jgi:hypothetical protein